MPRSCRGQPPSCVALQAWLLLAVTAVSGVAGDSVERGECYSDRLSGDGVQYTKTAGPDTTRFAFLVLLSFPATMPVPESSQPWHFTGFMLGEKSRIHQQHSPARHHEARTVVQVTPQPGTTVFAIRVNNAIPNSSLFKAAQPQGQFQTGYSSRGMLRPVFCTCSTYSLACSPYYVPAASASLIRAQLPNSLCRRPSVHLGSEWQPAASFHI